MIFCAGKNETFPFAQSLGVGLIESSINLTRFCLFNKPDFILFIGTAGSYGKYKIFDIVESTSACNLEISNLLDYSYTPIENTISINLKGIKNQTIVNSSNFITKNKEISNKFLEYNIDLENMEFYSIASVAKEFDIPFAGIFCVTNYTFKDAHKEYIKNYKEALKRLEKHLIERKII